MLVAITVWEKRISPLFEATRTLLVVNVDGPEITEKHYEPFDCDPPIARVLRLHDLGINILICGGISNSFVNLIEAQGIQIIPFVSGIVDEVIETYVTASPHG